MRRMPAIAAMIGMLLLSGCAAEADPEPTPTASLPELGAPLTAADLDDFGGVAVVDFASRCTATLIETGVDAAPAYVVTNGHCIGLDGAPANRTIVDEEAFGEARFFQTADTADDDRLRVAASRVEFATMRGTDVAIVRLDATLGELRSAGAVPLAIASEAPAEGADVVNIAAPTQGLDDDAWVLRRGDCSIGATKDVIEFSWLWLAAQRNDCPGVLGGSSGSPLIADGEVASIVNTTNTGVPVDRGDTCFLGKPCEIEGAAAVFVPETSYGVRVAGIGSCFVDGVFALGDDCPLTVTTLWDVSGGGIYGANGEDGSGLTPSLELRSASDVEVAVVANVPLDEASTCTDAATYASAATFAVAAEAEDSVTVPITLPVENGFELACAAVPGEEALAARFVFTIDAIPPDFAPELSVQDLGDVLMVDPLFDIPDIADIKVLYGPPDTTDCARRGAYRQYFRQPFFIDAGDLPVRFCAVGFDMAGNESPVSDRILD